MNEVLRVRELSVRLATKNETLHLVSDVSFTLVRDRRVALVGESGSGKSLTALAILGLLPKPQYAVSGEIVLEGRDLTALSETELNQVRGARIAMSFQEPAAALNPASSVGSLISESVRTHLPLSRTAVRQKAEQMLGLVGIANPASVFGSYPHELSGGMRQRVMLAAALSCSPDLLIADQPTSGVDPTTQAQLFDLLTRVQAETGMSLLMISHNLGVVSENADDMAVMYAGQIVEQGAVPEILSRPLHPYTSALIASVPPSTFSTAPEERRLPTLPHAEPADFSGCTFRNRCLLRATMGEKSKRCESEPPLLHSFAQGRVSRCHFAEHLHV